MFNSQSSQRFTKSLPKDGNSTYCLFVISAIAVVSVILVLILVFTKGGGATLGFFESLAIGSSLILNENSTLVIGNGSEFIFQDNTTITYNGELECISLNTKACVSELLGNITFSDSLMSYGDIYLEGNLLQQNGSIHPCCNSESILTTEGDLLFYGEVGNTRLPIGSESQILTVVDGFPEWRDGLLDEGLHDNIDEHINSTEAHGATGAVVGTTNYQTLINKAIDSETNNITIGGVNINEMLNQDVRTGSTPTFEGIYLQTATGIPSLLNYYEEYSISASMIGPWLIPQLFTISLVRVGILCNAYFSSVTTEAAIAGTHSLITPFDINSYIPLRFCPVQFFGEPKVVVNEGSNILGFVTILPGGSWKVSSSATDPDMAFTATDAIAGFEAFFLTYQCGALGPD